MKNQFLGVNLGAEIKTPKGMNIKRNIIFTLESRKKDGVLIVENVPIRMRVNFASKRIEFTTGYRIDAAKWDSNKQRVRNGCTNKLKQSASEINASLLGYYTEIQDIFKKFEVEEIMPTQEQIKEAFNALHKPIEEEVKPKKPTPNAFYKVFDDFVRDCGRQNDWTDSTYEKFAAVKNHLMNFRDGLTFDFFDEKGLNDYVTYLRDVKEMRNSTIGKQLSFLKWFLRWAFKKGVTYYRGNERIDEVTPKYALLGTHAGRRTFICNALALGIPPQVVMKWTGHSDYKAMKPYIDIADDIKANAMSKFNQL